MTTKIKMSKKEAKSQCVLINPQDTILAIISAQLMHNLYEISPLCEGQRVARNVKKGETYSQRPKTERSVFRRRRKPNKFGFGCTCSDFGRSVHSKVRISDRPLS